MRPLEDVFEIRSIAVRLFLISNQDLKDALMVFSYLRYFIYVLYQLERQILKPKLHKVKNNKINSKAIFLIQNINEILILIALSYN